MTRLPASGLQIAFLIFAVMLLAAAAEKYVLGQWPWARDSGFPVGRTTMFVIAAAILALVPALRRHCKRLLATPIPASKRSEVILVVGLDLVTTWAAVGAIALALWSIGGEPALARRFAGAPGAAEQWNSALSLNGVVTFVILAGFVGPVVEELVFRGMLYPALESRWGWIASALLTSVFFAALHPNKIAQFLGSILFICLLRRTGSLRASIAVHSAFNLLMWYPLLGQFVFPAAGASGELSVWRLHLACLAVAFFVVPVYMWMARGDREAAAASAGATPQHS
jgi:membrane protease YdiL (CAAX protease family)